MDCIYHPHTPALPGALICSACSLRAQARRQGVRSVSPPKRKDSSGEPKTRKVRILDDKSTAFREPDSDSDSDSDSMLESPRADVERQARKQVEAVKEELSVLLWNLQDLGGGPSRGPVREEDVIARIAQIINDVGPDICVLLEVKGRYNPGARPVKPSFLDTPKTTNVGLRASTKGKSDTATQEQKEKAQLDYETKLHRWEAMQDTLKAWETSGDTSTPGRREFMRIVEALEELAPRRWSHFLPEAYTGGETYGLLIKDETPKGEVPKLFLVDSHYISQDAQGAPLEWPKKGNRQPIRFRFNYRNQRTLDVVALHAPAPNHNKNQDALEAIANLGRIRIDCETIVMGDLNSNTEFEAQDYVSEDKPIPGAYVDAPEFEERADDALQEAMTAWQRGNSSSERETWIVGSDWERTSLKAKVKGTIKDVNELGSAAYDKIWLNTPDVNRTFLVPREDDVIPLVEYFMPEALHRQLDRPRFASVSEDAYPDVKTMQQLLDRTRQMSDHAPLRMVFDAYHERSRRIVKVKSLARQRPLDGLLHLNGFRQGRASGVGLNCLLHSLQQLRDDLPAPDDQLPREVDEMRRVLAAVQAVPARGMIDIGTHAMREVIEQMGLRVNLYQVIDGRLRLIACIGHGRDVSLFWSNDHFEPLWRV